MHLEGISGTVATFDGDDTIFIENGANEIWTGNGSDLLLVNGNLNTATVRDFEIGKDKISVSDGLDYAVEHKGWGSILTFETGGKMYITGAQIESQDFAESLEFFV